MARLFPVHMENGASVVGKREGRGQARNKEEKKVCLDSFSPNPKLSNHPKSPLFHALQNKGLIWLQQP